MQSKELKQNNIQNTQVSLVCVLLCVMMLLLLGVLPILPDGFSRFIRPTFIMVCIFTFQRSSYYSFGSTRYHLANLIYYTFIFLGFKINSSTVEAYISALLFIVFFLFAANRRWSKKEIVWIFIAIILACDFQSVVVLVSNSGLLHSGGSSHLHFLGATVNRNPVAFAITPGAICSMIFLLYNRGKKSAISTLFNLLSCLVCSFSVFALGCRSAFFSLVLGALCVIWQNTRDGRNSSERFGRTIIAILLIAVVASTAIHMSADTYSSRLFDFSDDEDNSGRDELWDEAWELIDEKPIFGGGFDYWEATGHTMGTHNTFLTFMVSTGWVGGILLGLFLVMTCLEILKTKNYIPLAFVSETLFHSWTEPGMDYYAYIPLVLAFIILKYVKYKNKNLVTLFM